MSGRVGHAMAVMALAAGAAFASDDEEVWFDFVGDAELRRTDFGNDGPISPGAVLPDIVDVRLAGWQPFNAVADPFSGEVIDPDDAHIFRLVVTFDGLVNPPGTLWPFDPFEFGPSPVFGFIDLDVDSDKDTGGECGCAAEQRFLANAARFGGRPQGSIGDRAAVMPEDWDASCDFGIGPQFERTGADFALVFCGCWEVTIVDESGDGDGVFEAGETWIVRGRFLERAQGYQDANDAFGGSDFGLYDPLAEVQFKHDLGSDTTRVTYVGALDMKGAATLTGEAEQVWNFSVADHTSILEGIWQVIDGAGGNYQPCPETLVEKWQGREAYDYLDPTDWEVTAIVGTPYTTDDIDGLAYAWTDVGFEVLKGDFDGDGFVSSLDEDLYCTLFDGPEPIEDHAFRFSMFDLDYDGVVDDVECASCVADFNDDGMLNILDFVAFQVAFQAGDEKADVNEDGVLNILDFVTFQQIFVAGC